MLVVGAGLGGLCLAHGLRRAGIDVAVHERDAAADTRGQGHRLHVDADGQRALAATLPAPLVALLGAFVARPAPRITAFDHRLRETEVFDLDRTGGTAPGGDADALPPHVAVDRPVLRQVLAAGLDDVVHYGRTCTGYESDGETVTVRFADGGTDRGTVLVAADGVASVIRGRLLPHARLTDPGVRLVYGRTPMGADLRAALPAGLLGLFNRVSGPGWRFLGIAPVEYRERPHLAAARLAPQAVLDPVEDTVAVMFGAPSDRLGVSDTELREASGAALRDLALGHLTGWHPLLRRLVAGWDPAGVQPILVRSSVPVRPWPGSNVTLLGDAIHAMSPAAGAGANVALRDAATLTAALTAVAAGRPLGPALRAYEHDMLAYSTPVVRRAAENLTRVFGSPPLPS